MPNPNLVALEQALRQPHSGFTWDFDTVDERTECGTVGCALGLALHLGILPEEINVTDDEEVGEHFGLSEREVDATFWSAWRGYDKHPGDVTQTMVADRLKELIDAQG